MNPVTFLRQRRRLNILLLISWALAIFAGSAMPGRMIPPQERPFSSLLHAVEYSLLGFLAVPIFGLYALPFCAAYGASDELHQLFVPGRFCDAADWMVDVLGSAAGAIIARAWGR